MRKQIIAMGGMAMDPDNLLLIRYFLRQTRKRRPRVCYIGTASGDAESGCLRFYAGFSRLECVPTQLPLFARTPRDLESFVLAQDAIFVGGGNTRSLLAVWRDWGLDLHLRTAWDRGIVLGGSSAGSIGWFEQGLTDSSAGPLLRLDCLGFLAGSNCPHYDSERLRRPTFRRLIAAGRMIDGLAADDGAALHYVDGRLKRAVASRRSARAWRVRRSGHRAVETRIHTVFLGGS